MTLCIRHDVYVHCDDRSRPASFTIGPVTEQSLPIPVRGVLMLILTDSQKVALTFAPKDKRGNPAEVQGPPVWTSSDESVVGLQVADDGLSATAVAAGPIGVAQVSVAADADLGDGVSTITGLLDIQTVAGTATTIDIAAGVPEEQ